MRVVCVKSYRNCRHRLFSFVSPEESCDAADKTSPRRHSSIKSNVVHLLDRFRTKTVKVRLRYFDFWVSCSCVWGSNQVSVDSGAENFTIFGEQRKKLLHLRWISPWNLQAVAVCWMWVTKKKKALLHKHTSTFWCESFKHSFGSTVAPDMNLKVLNSFSALEFDPRPAGQSFYCEMLEVCLKRDSQNEGTTKKLNTHVQERNKMSLTSSRVLERSSFPEAVLVKTCEQLNRSRTTRLSMKDLKCSEILYCSLKTRVPEGSADSVRCTAVTSSSSSTLGHTQVLTLFLRCEAVFVAVAAAVPEARAFVLFGVIEPDHGVVLAAALVLLEEAGVWKETGHTEHRFILTVTQLLMISSWLKERLTVSNQPRHDNTSLKVQ